MTRIVTVRQTLDPYVEDVQYFASHEATLTPEGNLDLTTIGIPVEPGRMHKYFITTKGGMRAYSPLPETNTFTADFVNEALSHHPTLTIVDLHESSPNYLRYRERLDAHRRAQQIERVKWLFRDIGSLILSPFGRLTASDSHSAHTTQILQDRNADTHSDPLTEPAATATAMSSHIPANSVVMNRRPGDGDGS